jgi:phosphatidylserine/phosphatidylglycerophosphate/cardiolipin synthase-like enzyme
MHTKVLVTDKAYASGSYNWTAAATNINDEILEVGQDETIRQEYQTILEEMFDKYKNAPQT